KRKFLDAALRYYSISQIEKKAYLPDKSTVLDRAMIEHNNLLSASK
uniref:COP9 signalosome complex subunit 4 (Fragments) n=1 Tax=Brassica oleracea TaxID=3712 RepID=CSN4_BRAOL|nr:RecName: Full=COP9 signalosome complex subunit 4; Short=Signalosome subunit 4; AltName: Full=Constitutive photomorphogenesis protein 8; AltName: Full=FUSCA protein 4; Short=FUSCA4 [Brassica oleracea]